ncbi:hypothetical protein VHEMI01311 [[Torrubiella] hemipterigena]|uniref:DUF676 domain-containing protein n=1 Tax=[Torrubiella] hemipterigena TaxID=1531966 RepID=A0A0A1T4G2_9HYPO|nr:hypothetical protein VHEMI01311 [[Torrubiella] hemipterigena]
MCKMNRALKLRRQPPATLSDASLMPKNNVSELSEHPALSEVYRSENPTVDIVAVHGINGDAFKTFTTQDKKCFWLGDHGMLPSDITNSRVLTYSYPANVTTLFGPSCSDTIMHIAHTLVAELVADREANDATDRPILFLCHSLGGIIVKRALIYSSSRTSHKLQHLHSIYICTYGIIFLGTPHQGSDKANLLKYGQRLVAICVPSLVTDTTPKLLEALQEGSETLQEITDGFAPIMQRFRIFFFWEQLKTHMGVTYDYVVSHESAAPILPDTERAGLQSNHQDICKFASRNSRGYKLIIAALRRYAREAPEAISSRWIQERELMGARRRYEADELLR